MYNTFLTLKFINGLKIFFLTFILLLLSSFLFYFFLEVKNVFSFLCGGLISIVSSFVFFFTYFYKIDNNSFKFTVKRLYIAGFLKFVSFIFFSICFFLLGMVNIYIFLFSLFFFQIIILFFFIFFKRM